MAKDRDIKDIEADLKRMLNMHPGTNSQANTELLQPSQKSSGVECADKSILENDKSEPPQHTKKNRKGKTKEVNEREVKTKEVNEREPKKKEDIHEKEFNNSALDKRGSEPEVNLEDGVVKKSKKKKKANKKKVAGNVKEIKDEVKSDSDSDQEEHKQEVTSPTYGYQPKYLDDKVTPAIIKEFEAERIFPLKKKSVPFPKALYFCRLCDFHLGCIQFCREHMKDARHRRRMEILLQDKVLKSMPTPSVEHYSALTTILEGIYQEQGLSDQEMKERETITESLEQFLQGTIPDLKLRIYGSSLTGFGLKSSDLNMDLVLPKGTNPAKGLTLVHKTLMQSDVCKEVRSNFQAKVPSVLFKSSCDKVNCEITIGSDLAYFTGRYLKLYAGLDDRLRKLAVIFRHWAKICELDDQSNGTLPSYCYDLMAVYFLQEIKVLPVLWKDLSEDALKRPKTHKDIFDMFEELQNQPWKCTNQDSIGMLWRDLVLFYGSKFDMAELVVCIRSQKVLRRQEKKWKSKRVAIEDPFSQKRNVARSMHSTKVFDYFYNCLRKASLYFNMPTTCTSSSSLQVKQGKSAGNHKVGKSVKQETVIKAGNHDIENSVKQETEVKTDSGHADDGKEVLNKVKKQDKDNGAESEESVVTGTESDESIKPHQFMEKTTSDSNAEISDLEESVDLVKLAEDLGENVENLTLDENEGNEPSLQVAGQNNTSTSSGENPQKIGAEMKTVEDVACDSVADDETYKCSTSGVGVETKHPCKPGKISKEDENESIEIVSIETVEANGSKDHNKHTDLTKKGKRTPTSLNKSLISDSKTTDQLGCDSKEKKKTIEAVNCDASEKEETVEAAIIETKSDVDMSDKGCLSKTESDMEPETPDSSPLKAKRKKSSSPCQLTENPYNFVFSTQTLTDGKGPSSFCQICEKEGHHKNNCPEDQLPTLKKLPLLTCKDLECLSRAVEKVPKDFSLSKEEIKIRESVRKNIELYLLDEFPDCELRLFGSSVNGFGFHQSDLDICVTFKNRDPKDIDFIQCIDAIAKRLKSHRGLYQVFAITAAKVPIVKFIHRNSQLEGDISLYNELALQNTKLIRTYASIDRRASILGFAIKVFAKVCDIGAASKGSLSSYAYMLLMFHYLQHTNPPIIPVLQELGKEEDKNPELMVDGWNAWFYDDLKSIPKIWPHYGKNTQSVGELWLGFFRYYMEEFNMVEQVASIRQFEPLTKFEKLWNGKCIAIEDPFDLNHNLGGGLSRRMNQHILRTFIHARELYGKPIMDVPNGYGTLEDYFFDREQLTVGKPPADRLCRVCGIIGHIAKECPRILARKERDAAERKRKEQMRQSQERNNNAEEMKMDTQSNNSNHQKRASSMRSKSNSADHSSPNKQYNTQTYHRQHSEPTDHRQMNRGPDGYHQHYNQPSSPQSMYRYQQPQSPNSPSPFSYKQQPPRQYAYRTGHPSKLFDGSNYSEGSNQRASHSSNHIRHSGNSPANHYMDTRNMPNNLHKNHPANQNRDYSSSPNRNAGYMNRSPQTEGQRPPQVSCIENCMSSSGVGFTNPIPNSPTLVYPSLGMQQFPFYTVLHPSNIPRVPQGDFQGNPMPATGKVQVNSMTTSGNVTENQMANPGNYVGNPLVFVAGPQTAVSTAVDFNLRNTMATSGNRLRYPVHIPMPGWAACPVPIPMPTSGAVYVQAGQQTTSQTHATPPNQGSRPERTVNIHHKSGPLEDVGITVKNDLYKGTGLAD